MCAGCGGLQALHEIYDVLGEKTVFLNAAGCMTLLSVYPFTPFRGSWLYTAMASAPAGAQGVRDALDILLEQDRMPPEEDLRVVVLTGDGAAYGMGLSATSGAIERGLDFLYIVYDNEGYGNTGQQYSGATPHAARTATSRIGGGFRGDKKDLFDIWVAHRPAYAATVIGAEPLDLARKVERAMAIKGPRLILALAPCPDRLGFRSEADRRHWAAGGPHRDLAAEGVCRRQGRAHQDAASAQAGRGIPGAAGPLRTSIRAAAQRCGTDRDAGEGR